MGKKCLALMVFFTMILLIVSSSEIVCAADIIAQSTHISSTYRQNEKIEISATIINNRTEPLTVKQFNITIVYAKEVGGTVRIAKTIIKDLGETQLEYHEALSVHVEITLNDLPPDTYNLSATFVYYYTPVNEEVIAVLENVQFQLLPFIEIPPAVIFIAAIMSAIILVYIGYGVAGRISKLGRRKM